MIRFEYCKNVLYISIGIAKQVNSNARWFFLTETQLGSQEL